MTRRPGRKAAITLAASGFLLAGCIPSARADLLLYNNTSNDTGDTVLYSVGPYIALGDQIQLISAGTATQAKIELFNNGTAGSFDATLNLFDTGAPVGPQIASSTISGVQTNGSDVIDLTFGLGAVTVPQDLI